MVLGQDIGCEPPYPVGGSDFGQTPEQHRFDPLRVVLVSDHNRDVSNGRVGGPCMIGHTDEPIPVECAHSALADTRLSQLLDEPVEVS